MAARSPQRLLGTVAPRSDPPRPSPLLDQWMSPFQAPRLLPPTRHHQTLKRAQHLFSTDHLLHTRNQSDPGPTRLFTTTLTIPQKQELLRLLHRLRAPAKCPLPSRRHRLPNLPHRQLLTALCQAASQETLVFPSSQDLSTLPAFPHPLFPLQPCHRRIQLKLSRRRHGDDSKPHQPPSSTQAPNNLRIKMARIMTRMRSR